MSVAVAAKVSRRRDGFYVIFMSVMANRTDFEANEAVTACWSCKGPVPAGALFCGTCAIIQPSRPLDHFARLGLRQSFDLEETDLQQRYFALQARLHPDRFASRSALERAASLAQATDLNEAYRTLRDPLLRAAYLLALAGAESPTDSSATVEDPELLMESLERREELAAAESPGTVQAMIDAAERGAKECVSSLSAAFAANDLAAASHLATRLKYLDKLAEEARTRVARLRGGP
jgi:molecular chaperone HscB